MSKSRMTLHVYRLGPDGSRTDLGSTEVTAGEPYRGARSMLFEDPCGCRRCHPAEAQSTPDTAPGGPA
ncbi:hypothetical protein ACFW1A_24095 [Kitasatospora sp. NPDC058965]|uniref:hypothetical protein n=1 Tax=Kitasatospora sp. NPDC058965 TaxID=3346682 RepID=UPI0036C6E2E5